MLQEMPDVTVSELTRQAIEDLFEGRNDRDYARFFIEEGLTKLVTEWQNFLGITTSFTVTSTEDGFRIVAVANRLYSDATPEVRAPKDRVSIDDEVDDFGDE
jgi:hypothetical protein